MKYEIGDKIILLHSGEEGTVMDIINDKMLMVEVEGVSFPVYMDQVDFPYFKMFTEKKIIPKKKLHLDEIQKEAEGQTGDSKDLEEGVFIRFFPVYDKDVFDEDVIQKLKVYLVNQNKEAYSFHYGIYFSGDARFELKNDIRQLSDFYLHDVQVEELSENPRFAFEFSLIEPDKNKMPYYEATVRLKARQFFKKMEEIQSQNLPSFSIELFRDYPKKGEPEFFDTTSAIRKSNAFELSKGLMNIPPSRDVVDLHIERIIDDYKGLSNYEILQKQLEEFEHFYTLSVLHRQPKLIVIHGIGEGTLRGAIHERLNQKKEVSSFVNQYHPLYGFGATEIYLSY